MKITFTEASWLDYICPQYNDKNFLKRVNLLIKEIIRNPFDGLGKSEPLKANLSGYWSRRINPEHRLVYEISEEELTIISCGFHYQK
jgi:toxin YoeB